MLDKLSLHSFQAHEDTVLEFSPGVNIITGVSNAGKTSLVRGLNLVVNNRPLGEGFINDDKNEAIVLLGITRRDQSFKIERTKDRKSKNSYKLIPSEGDSETFTAFGTSVPEEISNLLNFSDINLQQQLSPYFLVLDSPGQVALYIRKIARLDEIDEVVSLLSSEVRDCSKKKSNLDEEMLDVKKKLEELSVIDLDKLEGIISQVKVLEQLKTQTTSNMEEIDLIIGQIKQIDREMVHLPDDIEEKINGVDSILSDYEVVSNDVDYLEDIVTSLKEVEEKEISLPKDIENNILFIETLIAKYNNSETEFIYLSETIENLEGYETQMVALGEEVSQAFDLKQDLLKQLTECPSCGTFLTIESRKVLIGE